MDLQGKAFWVRALLLTISLALVAPITAPAARAAQSRSTTDRPDDVTGYQIHFAYVVPADVNERSWDTNGTIATWIDAVQIWLKGQISRSLIIDTADGAYDITFLKSKYTIAQLKALETTTLISDLTTEIAPVIGKTENPKTYLYIVDGAVSNTYCGRGQTFSNQGVFYGSPICLQYDSDGYSTSYYGLRSMGIFLIHEYFHTLGVSHTCINSSELMIGVPECTSTAHPVLNQRITIDLTRQNYFGGDKSGADISQMNIWAGGGQTLDATQWVQKASYSSAGMIGNSQFYAVVGKQTPGFSWGFIQELASVNQLSLTICTLDYGTTSITGSYDITKGCIFDVPDTWRVGKEFTVRADIETGPFWAKTSTTGILSRADYTTTMCTYDFCFTGEKWGPQNMYWGQDLGEVWLQELTSAGWETIQKSPCTLVDSSCTTNFTPYVIEGTGLHVFRQYIPASAKYSAYVGNPHGVLMQDPNSVEPTSTQISDATLGAVNLVTAYDEKIKSEALAEQNRLADITAAAKIQADKTAAAKLAAAKLAASRAKVTCVKGKVTKVVKGSKCPAGYKKK